MNRRLPFVTAVLAIGCVLSGSSAKAETWRASVDNGDKPGIGIELTRAGDSITGTMYILDPNKPGDFSAGSRHSMKMQKASERELHFSVEWKADVRDDMVLLLNAPLKEKELIGTLQDANKIGTPREYKFVRVK